MFDLGWFELAIVGGLLLIVVGPKDLPRVLRTVGVWVGKARKMAREFQKALDEYAKDAELDGVKKAVEAPMKARKAVTGALDPTGTLKKQLTETDKELRDNLKDVDDAVKDKPAADAGDAVSARPGRTSSDELAKTASRDAEPERKVSAAGGAS